MDRRPGLNAEMYRGLLDRESPRAADGVKYFRDTLRHHFMKGAQSVFLWRFYQFTRAGRGNVEMVSWMDMLPMSALSEEATTKGFFIQ